jgi:hypothetical protein
MGKLYRQYGAAGVAAVGAQFEQAAALSVLKQVDFFSGGRHLAALASGVCRRRSLGYSVVNHD